VASRSLGWLGLNSKLDGGLCWCRAEVYYGFPLNAGVDERGTLFSGFKTLFFLDDLLLPSLVVAGFINLAVRS